MAERRNAPDGRKKERAEWPKEGTRTRRNERYGRAAEVARPYLLDEWTFERTRTTGRWAGGIFREAP